MGKTAKKPSSHGADSSADTFDVVSPYTSEHPHTKAQNERLQEEDWGVCQTRAEALVCMD